MSDVAANQPDGPEQTDLAPASLDPASLDPASAWLAAYALGLAYSSQSHEDRVELLRDATGERPELLAIARERLETTDVVEPWLRDQARRLLDRARTMTIGGASGRLASDSW